MESANLVPALRGVVVELQRLHIPHYVGGSVASSVYGVARTTLDVDLIAALQEPHARPLAESLVTDYYVSESMIRHAIEYEACFNVIHLSTMLKVDVFVIGGKQYDQAALARIRRDTIGQPDDTLETFLASPEDVILNKLCWYELGDRVSQRQWQDVVGVFKVQKALLDRAYLQKWAKELNVSELLEQALLEVGLP